MNIEKYNQIVESKYSKLLKYCLLRLSFVKPDAEEVTDDVFVTLFLKWDELDLSDNISAWLYRVADNCIKRFIAKKSRDESLNDHMETIEQFNNSEDEIAELIEQISYKQKLDEIIGMLPENLKDIFVYRFIEEKTLQEIEKLTGIPYSTVRLRIKKAKSMVDNYFKHANFEENKRLPYRKKDDHGTKGGSKND